MHLERLILILETVSQQGSASVGELCEATTLPKPSAYRLVQDLVAAGLLEPVGKGRFELGTRLLRVARSGNADAQLLAVVAPMLKQAANAHGAAFFLSRLRGHDVEIVHVETPETGVAYLHPGLGRRPLHACSCSKAVAAFSDDRLLDRALQTKLRAYTEFTLTSADDLRAELQVIRNRGYAECVEEIERGMCSVAVPLAEPGCGVALSIGAAGSTRVFTESYREKMGSALIEMTRQIEQELGAPDTVGDTG